MREERSIIVYAVEEHMYLDSIHGQRERVQILKGEVRVSTADDEGPTLLNLLAHPLLILRVPRQLVRKEREGRRGRLVSCQSEREHLGHELCVRETRLGVR